MGFEWLPLFGELRALILSKRAAFYDSVRVRLFVA